MASFDGIRCGGGAGGRWEAAIGRPDLGLGGLVVGYRGFCESAGGPVVRRELPASGLVLLISLGEPLSLVRGGRGGAAAAAALVGVGREGVEAAHGGAQRVLEVRLSPLAAGVCFGVPASELAESVVDVAEFWPDAGELVELLRGDSGWAERFERIEAILGARAERGRAADPVLAGSWRQVTDRRGDLGIGVLHEQTGWSRKRLAQRFRAEIGLPPKAMANLVRFEHAVGLLRCPNVGSLAEVALRCGYYDQAHLNREFKEYAGCTPTAFLDGLDNDASGAAMAAAG
ncbi:helix-turn-helix domain-containing protein [Embleya scabrispora]|uniref:helix-turn-helix domain-containing protein n=1 Tax=Embleya scabrispora TaxID=159449 RepID=UPI00039E3085|nr:helix-turn-helix domain-containing protein [Embleya scabrispora]MYS87130.1 helix-turn-helix domain-containing protein [Streptomyces sp. SID5474]